MAVSFVSLLHWPQLDALFKAGERADASGAKGCGAGGGGYLLFLCGRERRDVVRQVLADLDAGCLPFGFAPRRGA